MMRVDGRRLVRAVALGLLCFLLLGGGIGFVAADGEEAMLAVPEPRPGDQVVYAAQRILLDEDRALGGTGDIRLDHVTYKWLPEQWVVDGRFGDRLARPLQAQYRYMSGTPDQVMLDRIVYYDAVDGRVLFQQYDTTSSGTVGGPTVWYNDVPVVGDVVIGTQSETTFVADQYHSSRSPCGVGPTPLQGTVHDGSNVVLQGRCGWEDEENQILYAGHGWDDLRGVSAYRFSALQDGRLQMWFDNSMPFPVQLTTSSAEITDPQWSIGRLFELTVESYSPGEGAYTDPDPATLPPAAGPLPLAPRTPWTLDDTGMEPLLPLTLQEAYLAALAANGPRSPLAAPHAAGWLQQHPEAYLAAGWALEYHDDSGETLPQWILLWVDGDSWLGKRVSWEAASQEVLLPQALGRHSEVTDWTPSWLPDDVDAFFPDLDQLPATFARPADMVAPYHRMFGEGATLNRYGFQVYCPTAECDDPNVLVEVGRHVEEQQTAGSPRDVAEGRLAYVDKLMVDSQGELEYKMRIVEATEAILPLDGGGPPAPPAATQAAAGGDGPRWVLPIAPAAATGISLVALVAGFLYYFWPHLKGAALAPLFSRIADDEVLDNPNRARILELIRAEPGIHFQDLSRKASVGRGTLDHHLRKLVDAELVTVRRTSGYSCCFPKGTGAIDRRLMDAAPVLRSQGGRAVLEVVARRPGASSRDLAVELGLAPSTVSYHLKRLETAGLVLPAAGMGVRLTPLGEQAGAKAA